MRPWVLQYALDTGRIDEIDAVLLETLMANSRTSATELAELADVSRPTVHDRLKKLHESKLLKRYGIDLNYDKAGLPITAFVLVKYDPRLANNNNQQKVVAKRLTNIKYVRRVWIITGEHDFLVEVSIDHMQSLAEIIIEEMRKIPGILNTETIVTFYEFDGMQKTVID